MVNEIKDQPAGAQSREATHQFLQKQRNHRRLKALYIAAALIAAAIAGYM